MATILYLACETEPPPTLQQAVLRIAVAHGGNLLESTAAGISLLFDWGKPLDCACILRKQLLGSHPALRIALHRTRTARNLLHKQAEDVIRVRYVAEAGWAGQIVLTEPTATTASLPENVTLHDLGVHLLPDLAPPQHLFQLVCLDEGPVDFPPLRTLYTGCPNNLLPQSTPLVGRQGDLDELSEWLADDETRLVTLSGPGGAGKTRLAVHLAAQNADLFKHGMFFVPLDVLDAPEDLPSAIAAALKLSLHPRIAPQVQLLRSFRRKRVLLILDGAEHLLPNLAFVAELLEAAPNLKIVVTSREPLRLPGERCYALEGLPFPNPDDPMALETLDSHDAVRLFIQSTRAVQPLFVATAGDRLALARIAQIVEGLPLALELAGSWKQFYTCQEIADELAKDYDFLQSARRDLPVRQRSLRAVFERSWNLLSAAEQEIFAQLAVFRGKFTPGAAAEIVGAKSGSLKTFVEKSLLNGRGQERYELHPLLRQFTHEKLTEQPDTHLAVQRRHAGYYTHFVAERIETLWGDQQMIALEELNRNASNIRAAWAWASREPDFQMLSAAFEAIFRWCFLRGAFEEGKTLFRQASSQLRNYIADHPADERAKRLSGQLIAAYGAFCVQLAENDTAEALLTEALEILLSYDLWWGIAQVYLYQGQLAVNRGRYHTARNIFEYSQTLCDKVNSEYCRRDALHWLGSVNYILGAYRVAREHYRQSLVFSHNLSDLWGGQRTLHSLGALAHVLGDFSEARVCYTEELEVAQRYGYRRGVAAAQGGLGVVAISLGDYQQARVRLENSLEIYQDLGNPRDIGNALNKLTFLYVELGHLSDAVRAGEEALGLHREVGNRGGEGFSLFYLAYVMDAQGQLAQAEALYAQAIEVLDSVSDHGGSANARETFALFLRDRGRFEEAEFLAAEALRARRESKSQEGLAIALSSLGWIVASHEENQDRTIGYLREAIQIGRRLAATPLLMVCLLGAAELACRNGLSARAVELASLVRAHVSASYPLRVRAAICVGRAGMRLNFSEVSAAEGRGKALALDETLDALLASWQDR